MRCAMSRVVLAVALAAVSLGATAKPSHKESKKSAPPVAPVAAPAKAELILEHRLDEVRAARLQELADRFNNSDKGFRVILARRNDGDPLAALNLLSRAEAAELSSHREVFRPLAAVLKDAKQGLDAGTLSPEVRSSDSATRLQSLPLAFAAPVLFYNKAAFRKAGLDPEQPPRTWAEVQAMSGKLYDSGSTCPYTTSWPAWMHIDNLSALNAATTSHGREMAFNGMVQVKHIALLSSWVKSRYFINFGRADEADGHFAKGECGMLTSTSDIYSTLRDVPNLEIGVAPLPYHDDVYGSPRNTLADGASLWIGAGRSVAEYRAAARFVGFLLAPENQVSVVQAGGFLPLTTAARSASAGKLLKRDLAAINIAYAQLRTPNKKAEEAQLRVSANEGVRRIVDEELEAVWANRKPAKEALDTAVARANALLRGLPKTHLAALQ